jgi:TPR repeat protein
VALLLKAAEAGDVAAQYQLWQHYRGDGRNEKNALKYLKQAASAKSEAQNPTYARSAIMDLAEHYLSNAHGEPQPDKAIKLLSRAAKQKYSLASYMLGLLFKEGKLVPQDMTEAAKWFRHGMEYGGHAGCTYELGLCYEKGLGVSQDATRAERYFKIAQDKNYEPALAR